MACVGAWKEECDAAFGCCGGGAGVGGGDTGVELVSVLVRFEESAAVKLTSCRNLSISSIKCA